MSNDKVKAGIQFLAEAGLNLFASLDCASLPQELRRQMINASVPLAEYDYLVLIGHGGKQLWTQLQQTGMDGSDPIDNYSLNLTKQFIHNYLNKPDHLLLYPGHHYLIPLQQLGEWAGWGRPSPLGQSIHPEFGVWFAHRTAFLTNADLPVIKDDAGLRPCDNCLEKPCLNTCPAEAVQPTQFNISACANFRIQPDSVCADRCLARMACPIAPQHRYTFEQIQYHYTQSLEMVRLYFASE